MLKHTVMFSEDCRCENGKFVRFDDLEVGACFKWRGHLFQKIETFNSEFEAFIFSSDASDVGFYDVDEDELVEFVPVVKVSMLSTTGR